MKMKLIGMVAFALLMPALAVWAQEEGGPQGGGTGGRTRRAAADGHARAPGAPHALHALPGHA